MSGERGVQHALPSLSDSLRALNTEMDCLTIGVLSEHSPSVYSDLYSRLDAATRGQLDRYLPLNTLYTTLRMLPGVFVEMIPPDDSQSTSYKKHAEHADYITAWAGHHLSLSERARVPLRTLVGEHVPLEQGSILSSSLEIRLGVLDSLYRIASRKWAPAGELYEAQRYKEVHPDTVKGHLRKLVGAGLVMQRPPEKGTRGMQYRIATSSQLYTVSPVDIIGIYTRTARSFRHKDAAVIEAGLDHMERFMSGASPYVGQLIERTFTSTKRSGKRDLKK